MQRDVFKAIADPTRREIITIISCNPLNINAVAENFTISRTAVYKHLKILKECGLVIIKRRGRESYCEIQHGKLSEVTGWLETVYG